MSTSKVIYPIIVIGLLIIIPVVGVHVLGLYNFFGIFIPYSAFVFFICALIYRIVGWAKSPQPFCIPTVCGQQKSLPWIKSNNTESPSTPWDVIKRMVLEILLFRSLFRYDRVSIEGKERLVYHEGKLLWLGGLLFHWSIIVIILRHLRFFMEPTPSWILILQKIDSPFEFLIPSLFVTDMLIIIALLYLLLRRLMSPRIKYISLSSDYFSLYLIGAILVTGILMRYVYSVDLLEIKKFTMGLISLHPFVSTKLSTLFYCHLFLVSILFAYIPMSKIAHMAGVFLSPTRNLMNISRMKRYINPWNYPVKVHTYEEWEDEFRDAMKEAGLPVEKEQQEITTKR